MNKADIKALQIGARNHVLQAYALTKQAKEAAEELEVFDDDDTYAGSYEIDRNLERLESILGDLA
jgi:hypothetical protein